jgi:hypothetical protein
MSDGLYKKFEVSRLDGQDRRMGDKHFDCHHFVLDITHDKFAAAALRAYAQECQSEFPELACDLEGMALINDRFHKRIT